MNRLIRWIKWHSKWTNELISFRCVAQRKIQFAGNAQVANGKVISKTTQKPFCFLLSIQLNFRSWFISSDQYIVIININKNNNQLVLTRIYRRVSFDAVRRYLIKWIEWSFICVWNEPDNKKLMHPFHKMVNKEMFNLIGYLIFNEQNAIDR